MGQTPVARPDCRPVASVLAPLCVLLLLSLPGCARPDTGVTGARHVVLISIDTARADHFGFLGNKRVRTPRLDALAGESIVFTDYMTVAPTTLASHTSLFTGKYPHNHGTPRNGFMVNRDNELLAEILAGAGFHAAGFVGSFAMDSRFDVAQGFHYYDETFPILLGEAGADQNQRPAEDVTNAVVDYLNREGIPERLFLFAHYFDPHAPYAAPAPFDTEYDPAGTRDLPSLPAVVGRSPLTVEERRIAARRHALNYAGEITYVDHYVGGLVEALRSRGILEDALLVISTDHGENLGDHWSQFDHGFTLYQSTTRAVWMVRLPNAERGGTRIDELVASIDVLPTILEFLGLAAPQGIDGESIDLRGFRSEPVPARTRFGQATKPWEDVETDPRWTNALKSRCLRSGHYKFIQTPYLGTEELYDLEADPAERHNLLDSPTAEVTALAAGLRRELESWATTTDPLPSSFDQEQLDETIERLKSLGYLK